MGVAFPVDPFQINRPLQVLRPPVLPQSAQNTALSQTSANSEKNASYTILNGADKTTRDTNRVEMTTVAVPIPQWSTEFPGQTSSKEQISPLITATVRPLLLTSGNFSMASHVSSPSTEMPLRKPLDYKTGKRRFISIN